MILESREIVLAHWLYVESWVLDLGSYGTDQFNVGFFLNAKDAKWGNNPFQHWQDDVGKEELVWAVAAEFTLERLEKIRQVEEEIKTLEIGRDDWLEGFYTLPLPTAWVGDSCVDIVRLICQMSRTLMRVLAALDELRAGMKI